MPKIYCIESTLDLQYPPFEIRLWINEKDVPLFPRTDVRNYLDNWFAKNRDPVFTDVHEFVLTIPDLNAVQICRGKFGVVIYTAPFEDVHG